MSTNDIRIPPEDADRLLVCADGLCALLYLHIARTGDFSLPRAARELKVGEAEIARAAGDLRRLGLLQSPERPPEERRLPEFTAADVARRAEGDRSFELVVSQAEKRFGRTLSSNDLKILLGIYEHLGLPGEVILLLLDHCVDEYRADNGPGRIPTMRYVEKEAWFWAEHEISSIDAAEEHLRRAAAKRESLGRVLEALQIRGREPTPGERKYINSWLELGFGPEALAIAYDRTVMSTGKLVWKYMDRIVTSWADKKLFTPGEIEAGDPRQAKKPAEARPGGGSLEDKIERMKRLNKHMGGGEDR